MTFISFPHLLKYHSHNSHFRCFLTSFWMVTFNLILLECGSVHKKPASMRRTCENRFTFLVFPSSNIIFVCAILSRNAFTLVIELLIFFRQRDSSSRDSSAHCTHVAGGCKYLYNDKKELIGFTFILCSKKKKKTTSPVVTDLSHCLQKCTVTCLGIPSEMST